MEYPVHLGATKVGTAKVSREGLYYHIQCICDGSRNAPYRIKAVADHEVDLGLCVPVGDCYGVAVRVPIKRLGSGPLRFFIKDKEKTEKWFPVSEDVPFRHMARLKDASLVIRDGQPGIRFQCTDQFPDLPDSDRSP